MQHRVADLQELRGRHGMQVGDLQLQLEVRPAPAQRHTQRLPDALVQHLRQRVEGRERLAVELQQDVAGLEQALGRRARHDVAHHQQALLAGKQLAVARLGDLVEPEAAEFVVRQVHERRQQGAARHRFAGDDALQRAGHAVERQEEAGRGLHVGAGVQCHHPTLDVDDGGTRGSARSARGGLDVERVEVVVLAATVGRRLAVETRDGAGQNGDLFAGIVADHPDLASRLRALGRQRQCLRPDVAQLRRVVAEKAEVMHRVAVHRRQLHFLVVQEHRFRHHRARGHYVPVGQDQATLRIHDEARRLARHVPVGVEGARPVDADGHDAGRDALERGAPVGRLRRDLGGGQRRRLVYRRRGGRRR